MTDDSTSLRFRLFNDSEPRRLTARQAALFVVAVQLLLLFAHFLETAGFGLFFVRPFLAIVAVLVSPGLLLLILMGIRDRPPVTMSLFAVGVSAVAVMFVGVSLSLFFPVIGVKRPVSELQLLTTLTFLNVVLAGVTAIRTDTERIISELSFPEPTPSGLFFLTIPFLGVIAITSVNRYVTNIGGILFLLVLSLVPLIVLLWGVDPKLYPLVVWSGALGLLYFKSMWSGSYPIEMWMHEMVIEQGRWVPAIGGDFSALPDIRGMGQEGVLTDAVLYPIYSLVAGIEMMTVLEVINPLFVSLIPLGMYEAFRRYVSKHDALLSAFVFIFTFRFYSQHYPNGPRDVVATLFIVLIALLIADSSPDNHIRRGLAVVFSIGLVVSHYGTAYLLIPALSLALIGFIGLKLLDEGFTISPDSYEELAEYAPTGIVNISFIILVSVIALSWYLFTAGGIKFELFVGAFSRITSATQVSGLASERVLSARPLSIDMTRAMIGIIFMLIAFGMLSEIVRKVTTDTSSVSDEHLLIAGGLVGVFVLSFTRLGTGFGQGRILMLCLSLSSIFVVLGLHNINPIIGLLSQRNDSFVAVKNLITNHFTTRRIHAVISIFLCVFLLFNTGVVAETVTRDQDYGASIIVNNERLSESGNPALRLHSQGCIQCDIQTRVWTLRYGAEGARVYHGGFVKSHYWYGHSLVAQLDNFVPNYLLANQSILYWSALPENHSGLPTSAYFVLNSDNYASDRVVSSGSNVLPIRNIRRPLNQSDRIYTSGNSTVHRLHSQNTTSVQK